MKKQCFSLRRFRCPTCDFEIDMPKKSSCMTPINHIKHIWCPRCKDRLPFIQLSLANSKN